MKIIVTCTCGVEYEFDVEPVDGAMPGAVACPDCGADGTDFANGVIQVALETQLIPSSRQTKPNAAARDDVVEPVPPLETEAQPEPAAGLPKFCYIHSSESMEGFCFNCKRPICASCMKQFGFFCGSYCRDTAKQAGREIPEFAGEERAVRARKDQRTAHLFLALIILVIAVALVGGWYRIWGRKPAVIFRRPLTSNESFQRVQFVSNHELLLIGADKISVFDFKNKRDTWNKSFAGYRPEKPPVAPTADTSEAVDESDATITDDPVKLKEREAKLAEQLEAYEDANAHIARVRLTDDMIWVTFGRNVIGIDRATGTEKIKTRVEGRIEETTIHPDAILVVSRKATDYVFTHVQLPSGLQTSRRVPLPPPPPLTYNVEGGSEPPPLTRKEHRQFAPADGSVAAMDVKLIEQKIVSVDIMKPADPEKFNEGVGVTQVREYAEDVFNDMKRMKGGGSVDVDESRYQVTIERLFRDNAPPWTGEVVGPPRLFSLQTVDVLVAGKMLYVFDRNNQKLWESSLSYPLGGQFEAGENWLGEDAGDEISSVPCVERGDTLHFFDQGVLTAFDINTGAVRWRIPSVGVSRLQFDANGILYVTTTSASPDAIKFAGDINLTDPEETVIVKVEPATGEIVWRMQKAGDQCYLANQYMFATKAHFSVLQALTSGGDGSSGQFRLFRVNPRNGKKMWEFKRDEFPSFIDFQDNTILLQYFDKIEVLKFLAL